MTRPTLLPSIVATVLLALTACSGRDTGTPIDADDISGRVTGVVAGPAGEQADVEAGVWVIAETDAFDTRFARIVVTDARGRFVVPDLPPADYRLWVRGYGLRDSQPVAASRGSHMELTVSPARDAAEAAAVYPAAYWYSMMRLPDAAETADIPGGRNGYLMWMKNMACVGCHQLGQLSTRTLPASHARAGDSQAAWLARLQAGQAGGNMMRIASGLLQGLPIHYLAEWTDRISAGALPHATPDRPQGIERNVVATVRDWSTSRAYLHDLSGTDRRNPTVNGYGPLYGAPELSTDVLPILDPVNNRATSFAVPVRDPDTPTTADDPVVGPSHYWGTTPIWDSQANIHNPMLDADGRVWLTARIRGPDNPPFCRAGSNHPSAKRFPTTRSSRHLSVYDPRTGNYQFVDTCFSTHHLQFDAAGTLWTSGGGDVLGWLDAEKFLATGDAAAAQGWSPLILDTNGNGRLDTWVEPGAKPDPDLDTRVPARYYAVMPNPADGSIWGSTAFSYPGGLSRFDPATGLGERFDVPLPGFGVRGADIDSRGVVWVSLGSGHLGRFERALCKGPLNGPDATGNHCPEGWTFHRLPGPAFVDEPDASVESSYYTWVDQHNTLGLGRDVPMVTGNLFDGVHAFVGGRFVTLRIPAPLGFYTKGFEGRIDDPNGGWKGRGLWVPGGDRTPWLMEGGMGSRPLVVHFQLRPDPLAH